MERDPSLHIRKSDLVKVLGQILLNPRTPKSVLVDEIFREASPYQIKTRYLKLLEQKAAVKKKVSKSLNSDEGVPDKLVEEFNAMLYNYRKVKTPYAKIRQITKKSSDYLLLKEIAKLAYEFAEHFDIEPRKDGWKEYVTIGYDLMPKYALNKFKYYEAKIYENFQNKLEVLQDDKVEDTAIFYVIWQRKIMEHSGLSMFAEIDKDYNKYVHIVYGRRAADAVDADYEFWIESQFDGLAFMKALPELSQFYGENAQKRFEQYLKKIIKNEESESEGGLSDYYE